MQTATCAAPINGKHFPSFPAKRPVSLRGQGIDEVSDEENSASDLRDGAFDFRFGRDDTRCRADRQQPGTGDAGHAAAAAGQLEFAVAADQVHSLAAPVGKDLGAVVTCDDAFSLAALRSEEHTSELQSLMRISYAVFCLKQTKHT